MVKRDTETTETGHQPRRSGAFSWDELRYFLAVCETRSFRAAAKDLHVSTDVVRRKIDTLEAELSTVLFARSSAGAEMTADARSVYSICLEIREQVGYLDRFAVRKASEAEGMVRLTVTEGLGSFWLSPQITGFLEKFPRIRLDLRCEMRLPDLSRLESDVAIQFEKPEDETLVCRKIATIHLLVFASHDYLEKYGSPETYADLPKHRFVHLVANQIPHHMLSERVKSDPQLEFARVITNTSSSQALAIADGAGVGVLPSYAVCLSDRITPTAMDFHLSRPVWLVFHRESIKLQRVRKVVDWIVECFDGNRFPWFREEFIPPSAFSDEARQFPLFMRASGREDERTKAAEPSRRTRTS